MNPPVESKPPNPSAESVSKASSELNNLLQIISGTSALIENGANGPGDSAKYLAMLRTSIERAEKLTAELAQNAGGTHEKSLLNPRAGTPGPASAKPTTTDSPKPSIVLVDDEEMTLVLVTRILTEAGFQVSTASSGFLCLDLVRKQPHAYDLVLLDLTMPFMDGEETFSRLRELRADLPVVLCTGFIQHERLQRLMSAGLTGFLRKPIAPDEILSFVRSTLAGMKYAPGRFQANGATAVV